MTQDSITTAEPIEEVELLFTEALRILANSIEQDDLPAPMSINRPLRPDHDLYVQVAFRDIGAWLAVVDTTSYSIDHTSSTDLLHFVNGRVGFATVRLAAVERVDQAVA